MDQQHNQVRLGMAAAAGAHILWGIFPLYWKLLGNISPASLVCHRIIWAFAFLVVLVPILIRKGREATPSQFKQSVCSVRVWSAYAVAAVMLSINWLAFIWAVTHDQVLQASLGYYINPLLSVLLGVIVLRERLQTVQWLAIAIAAIGVSVMTIHGGGLPLASIAMATSFAVYGLIKKRSPLPSLSGLLLECTVLIGPAILWLMLSSPSESRDNFPTDRIQWLLVVAGGLVTVLPLTLFAMATKRIPLSTAGVLQYIGPTLQFLIGAVIYGEAFEGPTLVAFACVWFGSVLYLLALARSSRAALKKPAPATRLS